MHLVARFTLITLLLVLSVPDAGLEAQENAPSYYTRGLEQALKADYPGARAAFAQALKMDPSYAPAQGSLEILDDVQKGKIKSQTAGHLFKAAQHARKGDWAAAIAERTKAIELDPQYPVAYNGRGVNYHRRGWYDHAIRDYTKALELNPRYAPAYSNRGSALLETGRFDEAIRDYSKALELNPQDAATFFNRGNAYLVQGQFEAAIRDFTQAVKVNPKFAAAYLNKAVACERAGRNEEALEAYRSYLQYAPPQEAEQISRARRKVMELTTPEADSPKGPPPEKSKAK